MNKYILLSFDIEEFDITEEYGQKLDNKTKLNVSALGTRKILALLDKLKINATFFITGYFALKSIALIKDISKKHEIASHGFKHSSFSSKDLIKSRKVLKKITGQEITGFRMARLKKVNYDEINKAGYKYSSSINPTFIPGRYNNLNKKRTPYFSEKIIEIPVSVTPLLRFPLFWLSFKNFPLWFIKIASLITLKKDSYINIYFHPWEFVNLSNYTLPSYIKNPSDILMIKKLNNYLIWLKGKGKFITINEFRKIKYKYSHRP